MGRKIIDYKLQHSKHLENICKYEGLRMIGENPEKIRILLKEPIYLFEGSESYRTCPDLFIGYYDHLWTVAELKHSKDKYKKAIQQIESGVELLVDFFKIPIENITGKFITYGGNNYKFETINFD
jgi:hypothetical protein